MSSTYRDDNTENAAATGFTWGGLAQVVEETVAATGALIFGLFVLHDGGSAAATDGVTDAVYTLVAESATAGNVITQHQVAATTVKETGKATNKVMPALLVWHADTADATDAVVINTGSHTVSEAATATDTLLTQRLAEDSVSESATAADTALQAAKASIIETATVDDSVIAAIATTESADETATASDAVTGTLHAHHRVLERGQGASGVTQHVGAVETVQDWADAWSRVLQEASGQIWTANTGNWAMSRYSPCNFTSLAVIDGVVYATSDDGVYAFDGSDETITATLTTGQMDVGQGQLAHLTDAYLAYELAGSASMSVTQTQGGSAESYLYSLPAKSADTLTTGRFQFGRGLRGRHFTFSLSLTGTAGYINDLRVVATPVKRRI